MRIGSPHFGKGLEHLEQRAVLPNIIVSGVVRQESPPRSQSEKSQNIRAPLVEMRDMKRFKEVRICRRFTAGPDVPPARVANRRVTQAIDRKNSGPHVL